MYGKGHHNIGCICKDLYMKGLLSTRSVIFRLEHETKFILHHDTWSYSKSCISCYNSTGKIFLKEYTRTYILS